jgi:hypothetical protein
MSVSVLKCFLLLFLLSLGLTACQKNQTLSQKSEQSPQPTATDLSKTSKTYRWPPSAQLLTLKNYGTSSYQLGTTKSPAAAQQFLRAYQAQQPGRWELRATTIEGDPVFTHYYYLGQGRTVYVEHDSRQDEFSAQDFEQYQCDRLVPDKTQAYVRMEGCHFIQSWRKVGQ